MAKEFMQLHLDHMPGWDGTCVIAGIRNAGRRRARARSTRLPGSPPAPDEHPPLVWERFRAEGDVTSGSRKETRQTRIRSPVPIPSELERALVGGAMTAADIDRAVRAAIHANWRVVQPRLIATLSRMLRDGRSRRN